MNEYWLVSKQGVFLENYIRKVVSYHKNRFAVTIIKEKAHRYKSERNAVKASIAFGGTITKEVA